MDWATLAEGRSPHDQMVPMKPNVDLDPIPVEVAVPASETASQHWVHCSEELLRLASQPKAQLRVGELLLELQQLVVQGIVGSSGLKELREHCGLSPERVRQLCWVAHRLRECAEAEEIRALGLPFSLLRVIVKSRNPVEWARRAAKGKPTRGGGHRNWYLTELQEAIAEAETERKNPRQRSCKGPDCNKAIPTQSSTAIVVRIGREPRFYLCSPRCAAAYFDWRERAQPEQDPKGLPAAS